jgi:hypothetical protein
VWIQGTTKIGAKFIFNVVIDSKMRQKDRGEKDGKGIAREDRQGEQRRK